jgi:nucleoside phosphorylase
MGDAQSPARSSSESLPAAPPAGLLSFLAAKRPRGRFKQRVPRCEKILFVATKTEALALEFAAREQQIEFRRCMDEHDLGYFDLGEVSGDRILAIRTEMGPLAETGSAAKAIYWRRATGATEVISVGMAFGVSPEAQSVGDILISEGVLPYDNRIVRTGEQGEPVLDYGEVQPYPANEGLRRRFQTMANAPSWRGHAWSGLFLSGAARIHCASFRDELTRQCKGSNGSPVVGGDMESVGLLSASDARATPCWVAVKAISDFADWQRDEIIESTRPIACYCAARFVLEALRSREGDHG